MLKKFIQELNKKVAFNSEIEFIEFLINFIDNSLFVKTLFIDTNRNVFFKDDQNIFIKSSVSIDNFKNIISTNIINENILKSISNSIEFSSINSTTIRIDLKTLGILIHENIYNDSLNDFLPLIARELINLKNKIKDKEILNRYQILTELSDDMIIILENFKIIYANKITYKKCNASYADIINQHMTKFIHPDDKHKIIWLFKNINSSEELPKDYFFRLIHKDKIIFVRANSKIINSKNKPSLLVYMKDVTEQVQLEEKMNKISKEKDKMEKISSGLEKFAAIGQLSSSIIHEINQPLQSIQTIIDSINYLDKSTHPLSYAEILGDLSKVSTRIDRITNIINSMRSLMNINTSIEISLININKEIETVLNFNNMENLKVNVEIETKFYDDNIMIKFSSIQFQQIMINLINNAISSLKKTNRKDSKITISTSKFDNKVIIEVKDNGIGIENQNLPEIFSPFFSTNQSKNNSGLGLFIIKHILSCYNGSISCHNEKLGGATFIIEIIE